MIMFATIQYFVFYLFSLRYLFTETIFAATTWGLIKSLLLFLKICTGLGPIYKKNEARVANKQCYVS